MQIQIEAVLYVLAALITIILISLAPSAVWALTIAWFAWCGGILFERLNIEDWIRTRLRSLA